ncbi:protein phosphatase 1 regulatory subunit 3C-B [Pempheris klunzingeri]|uniref:protein phosphatase 1 regulatory subunit 3C-B n=1 Tax=Pempheris klunzingeri TaxID=3127111 RepID=UPI00397F17EE
MNCTRVLNALGSHPQPAVMPVDLAMCLSLRQRQPLYQLLSMSPLKPTEHRCQPAACPSRSSLRSPHQSSSPSHSSLPSSSMRSVLRSSFRRDGGGLSKKRVVFADAKGLALTAVRLFIPEPPPPAYTLVMIPSPAKLQGQQSTSDKLQRYKLRLGFLQPVLDFNAFLARLQEMCVQLVSCKISEHSLSGRVCVSHVSTEKAVHVKMTFDSWQSNHDIPCTFLQHKRCGGSEIDVFAFDISLPKNIDPNERVEFCVSFKPGPGTTPHWDDNRGQNYRVLMEKDGSNANQDNANRYHPTFSKHQPQSWPSQVAVSMQTSADLQRSLSSRVRAEWQSLCSAR